MNVLMNLYPVQSGGGQQVAINFIRVISQSDHGHNWFFYVGKDSEIHEVLEEQFNSAAVLALPYSYRGRILNRRKLKLYIERNSIDIIYNYAPVLAVKGVPQVVRTVYSNLYYPDVDFWSGYSRWARLRKRLIDFLRLRGTLSADGLVFENEGMLGQAVSLFKYPVEQTIYVAPSVTAFDEEHLCPDYEYLANIESFKILYISSWHLNKNIHRLPDVALELKSLKLKVKFILSLDLLDPHVEKYLIGSIERYGVSEYFEFIGKVDARFVHQVLRNVDAVILLSKLECFSSSIIEAYAFNKPLIISNESWSRAACKNAAIYVDRDNPCSIANGIVNLVGDMYFYDGQVVSGQERLAEFNTPISKVDRQVEFLELVYRRFCK